MISEYMKEVFMAYKEINPKDKLDFQKNDEESILIWFRNGRELVSKTSIKIAVQIEGEMNHKTSKEKYTYHVTSDLPLEEYSEPVQSISFVLRNGYVAKEPNKKEKDKSEGIYELMLLKYKGGKKYHISGIRKII